MVEIGNKEYRIRQSDCIQNVKHHQMKTFSHIARFAGFAIFMHLY